MQYRGGVTPLPSRRAPPAKTCLAPSSPESRQAGSGGRQLARCRLGDGSQECTSIWPRKQQAGGGAAHGELQATDLASAGQPPTGLWQGRAPSIRDKARWRTFQLPRAAWLPTRRSDSPKLTSRCSVKRTDTSPLARQGTAKARPGRPCCAAQRRSRRAPPAAAGSCAAEWRRWPAGQVGGRAGQASATASEHRRSISGSTRASPVARARLKRAPCAAATGARLVHPAARCAACMVPITICICRRSNRWQAAGQLKPSGVFAAGLGR